MEAVPAQQTHLCSLSVQPSESDAAECQTWRSFEWERAWSCRHPVSNAAAALTATRRRLSGASSRTAASRPFTRAHARNLLLNASMSFPSLPIRAPPPPPLRPPLPPVCSLSFFLALFRDLHEKSYVTMSLRGHSLTSPFTQERLLSMWLFLSSN